MDEKRYWQNVYAENPAEEVSWFQEHSQLSLKLIEGVGVDAAIIDVGGGASPLAGDLLARGYHDIAVLDISSAALAVARARLRSHACQVTWLEGDITVVDLERDRYDIWHDRAVFHFLTGQDERQKYIAAIQRSVRSGGYVLISTFALDGPDRCSGLDTVRYSAETLADQLGKGFTLDQSHEERHYTPFGAEQNFIYCLFKKR